MRYWTTSDPLETCCNAAKKGNVQQLLDALRNVDNINCVNRQGFTPLMIAANSRMRACMQLLIDRKADVNARGHAQYTPLHWMAYTGYVDELRMLLNAGADVKARDNSRGQTPLHWAVRAKHLRAAQVLLEHASVPNASDSTHRTALHQAASGNDAMMISLLLFYGASTRMRDQSGKLPVELLRDRSLIELFRAWESDDMSQVADAAPSASCARLPSPAPSCVCSSFSRARRASSARPTAAACASRAAAAATPGTPFRRRTSASSTATAARTSSATTATR